MKKLVSLLLAIALVLSVCSFAVAEEKPTLKIMNMYQTYNFEDQPQHQQLIDMTGYDVEWYMTPSENGTQMVMMQIASGECYDLLFHQTADLATQLYDAGLLMPLNDLLDQYGENIKGNPSAAAWKTATAEDGTIFALPSEAFLPQGDASRYGLQQYGIMFNMDKMNELGLELPSTIDEFYAVCKAYTEATGNPAFTAGKGAWEIHSIMPAYGMGTAVWYAAGDEIVHRLNHPGLVDYVTFMQKMYAEGLLDPDMPINSNANATEKFTTGKALCMVSAFFNYDSVASGFAAAGTNPELLFVPGLTLNEGDTPILYRAASVSYHTAIPVTAEHPEDVMKWLNIISEAENNKAIYIGEEGVHYQIIDGGYWPIQPAFGEKLNADKFVAFPSTAEMHEQWMARARKTETIGASFAQINEGAENFDIRYVYEGFANGIPAVYENQAAIDTFVGDELIKLIVEGGDVAATIDQIREEAKSDYNFDEMQEAMNEWYVEYASVYDWSIVK